MDQDVGKPNQKEMNAGAGKQNPSSGGGGLKDAPNLDFAAPTCAQRAHMLRTKGPLSPARRTGIVGREVQYSISNSQYSMSK